MKPELRRKSATTQVKVLSPEILLCCTKAKGFISLKPEKRYAKKKKVGERIETCRGLSPWRATELLMPEPGRANSILREAADKLNKGEEAVRRIGSRTGSY